MITAKNGLLLSLLVLTVFFVVTWIKAVREGRQTGDATLATVKPSPTIGQTLTGFVTNFFDTLGIGSFATTTSIYKLRTMVPDELIPGTLNVGHALATVTQAMIYISIVNVEIETLALLIASSVLGAWLGAGVVASWPRRAIQVGMGTALFAAALLMFMTQLGLFPPGGDTLELHGARLIIGMAGNFILGALMTLGIGLYAPCMILISMLGMNPTAAFPIMMGSCAFLMPVGSLQFIRKKSYHLQAAIGLVIGGIPAVLIAAFIVGSLPLVYVRWLVIAVVLYTAGSMLRSARLARAAEPDARVAPAAVLKS